MPLIDGLAVLGAAGVVILGILGVRFLRRKERPEIAGGENARKAAERGKRRCHFCRKPTNVGADVFLNGVWYCLTCFMNEEGKK